jgi:hypothetical protein
VPDQRGTASTGLIGDRHRRHAVALATVDRLTPGSAWRQSATSTAGRVDCRPCRWSAPQAAMRRSGTPAAFDHPLPHPRSARPGVAPPAPPGCERALVILHTLVDTGGHSPRAPLAAPPKNPAEFSLSAPTRPPDGLSRKSRTTS